MHTLLVAHGSTASGARARLWGWGRPQKEKGSIIKNRMEETPEVSSHEEAVEHFRRLLADAGVRWGAKWRDIYKDLATDGRYKLLKRGERKQVRQRAAEPARWRRIGLGSPGKR